MTCSILSGHDCKKVKKVRDTKLEKDPIGTREKEAKKVKEVRDTELEKDPVGTRAKVATVVAR